MLQSGCVVCLGEGLLCNCVVRFFFFCRTSLPLWRAFDGTAMKCLKAMVLDLAKGFFGSFSLPVHFHFTTPRKEPRFSSRSRQQSEKKGESGHGKTWFLVRSRRRKGKKGSARPFIRMKALLQLCFHAAVGVVGSGTRWAYKGEKKKFEF